MSECCIWIHKESSFSFHILAVNAFRTFNAWVFLFTSNTAQKMKFSIKNFFSKCNQIRRKLQIWSHLQKKSLMENFIFVQWKFFWFVLRNVKTPLTYSGLRLLFDAWSKVKSNFLETKSLRSIQRLWSTTQAKPYNFQSPECSFCN